MPSLRTPLLALAAAASAVPAAAQHGPPACHVVVPQFRTFAHAGHHPVVIERVDARVRIVGQTARTTLTIDLHNPGSGQAEAVILLPVPGEAAVSGFAFAGPAPEPTARLLPAEEARATYADIVRRLRDPGLLEFAGARLIRSSVFPIAAHGRSKVRLNYEHVLEADGPRIDYVLLRSEALGRQAPWTIDVDVETRRPIAIVYSPSHAIDTRRVAANRMRVQLAAGHEATPGAFRLSLVTDQGAGPAASLFAYPDPRVGGGYYLLLLGAPPARPGKPVRREVTVVLDRSGSMAGEKLDQARAAALQVIAALDDGEQFNLIDYATTVERFAPRPVVKDDRSLAKVSAYLGALRPLGGTNTHDALLEALRQPTDGVALPIVLFLTDGLPTVGTTAERAIREMVAAGNAARRRVFTFGVGEDVNVPLLDRIAEGTGATSTYVLPGEDVELKVARVFKKLSGPVLAGPAVTARGADGSEDPARLRERIPQRLPDLFDGDSLVVLGQYRGEGPLRLVLSGMDRGEERVFCFEFDLDKATTRNAFVPRLWAARRVADLIDRVRQAGAADDRPRVAGADAFADPALKELRDEILRLSTEFGILTEYTAFLATEGTDLGNWNVLAADCQAELNSRAVLVRHGLPALNQSFNLKQFGKEQAVLNPNNLFFDDKLDVRGTTAVQQVCDRAFFRRGSRWIDGRLIVSGNLEPARTIQFGSPAHEALVERMAREGRAGTLSLEGEIVTVIDGEVVAIVE